MSSEIDIPCAVYTCYILLPKNTLSALSQIEMEAVIAHELQHLKWKDPILKLCYSVVSALCWWIPTAWWLKRVIADQEQSCDAGIYHYGIDSCALASALNTILSKAKDQKLKTSAMCFLSSSKCVHIERVKHILDDQAIAASAQYVPGCVFAAFISFLAFISLWMC